MTRVVQFVPTLEPGAVGAHTLAVHQRLQAAGVEALVCAEQVHPAFGAALPYRQYGRRLPARDGDVLLYQLAIGSQVAAFLSDRAERLVVWSHNVTPPAFYEPWEPAVAEGLALGRRQLKTLAARASIGIGASRFNATALHEAGYEDVRVAPPLVDVTDAAEPDGAVAERLAQRGGTKLLFVGRLAPNKAQHRLVATLAVLRRLYDSDASLHLVGSAACAPYAAAVEAYAQSLGVGDHVEIPGPVTNGELAAYWAAADVFVSASAHEGVCLPLLEAMQRRVPVIAFAATAVPETAAGAALLVPTDDPVTAAAAVARITDDAALRSTLVERGARRATAFSAEQRGVDLVQLLGL